MTEPTPQSRYDVVVIGGGHNGLTAAAYLAQAGLSVLVLERLGATGGAAVSQELFQGLPARFSPYANLVGLFPERISKDLALDVQLRPRRTAAYVPAIRGGRHAGLMVERRPTHLTEDSFKVLTGSGREYDAWRAFHGHLSELADVVGPSLLEPLTPRAEMQRRINPETWRSIVEEPIGHAIEEQFEDDLVRGLVACNAVYGTFSDLHSPDLDQNRTFLTTALGDTGEGWRVPIGGMGAMSAALERTVRQHGGEIMTRAFVTRMQSTGTAARVAFRHSGSEQVVECNWVLSNVAPWVVRLMLGENPGPRPEGSVLKIDMLLDRLPRLRAGVSPPMAFAGTVHFGTHYEQLQQAFLEAQEGFIPEMPPGVLFCHSLTDPSVLGTLAMEGKHAFSFLGFHAPARLFSGHVDVQRDETVLRILDSINTHLEEPIESLVSLDVNGNPCLLARAPQDVEATLAMPGGHLFHGPLSWPWHEGEDQPASPAERWGVATDIPNVLLCGAGAVRGGGVSGVGGHNAAMAVLEATGRGGPATSTT
jgi:phytoene dehydrogenase-like protein